ncbi:hypothetical protein ACQYWQ_29160 [Streptomyces sp. P6-2-1]|uniref:hypothetical protein n=1 Tax=Streptomyces sp. P6-2-1 TaxID=3422591 RepID=UPI003D36A6C5
MATGLRTITSRRPAPDAFAKAVGAIAVLAERPGAERFDLNRANAPVSARLAGAARYVEPLSAPAVEWRTVAVAFGERMGTLDGGVRAAPGPIETTPRDERGVGRRGSWAG